MAILTIDHGENFRLSVVMVNFLAIGQIKGCHGHGQCLTQAPLPKYYKLFITIPLSGGFNFNKLNLKFFIQLSYKMADNGAESRLQRLGDVGTQLVSGVSQIRQWVTSTDELNETLASVTGRGNQLSDEERLVTEKLVTSAQKLRYLNSKGLDLVTCLGRICLTAKDPLECGINTEKVITTYMNDLDVEVMTTRLPETLAANREADDSLVEVKVALDQLIAWCGREAARLPGERDQQVRSTRINTGARTASHVLNNAANAFRTPDIRMQAAAAILSGFALIAGYVESEHYRVPAIQDSYNSLIERLNVAVDYWGLMISRVRVHQQTLVESERKWLQLQSIGADFLSIFVLNIPRIFFNIANFFLENFNLALPYN